MQALVGPLRRLAEGIAADRGAAAFVVGLAEARLAAAHPTKTDWAPQAGTAAVAKPPIPVARLARGAAGGALPCPVADVRSAAITESWNLTERIAACPAEELTAGRRSNRVDPLADAIAAFGGKRLPLSAAALLRHGTKRWQAPESLPKWESRAGSSIDAALELVAAPRLPHNREAHRILPEARLAGTPDAGRVSPAAVAPFVARPADPVAARVEGAEGAVGAAIGVGDARTLQILAGPWPARATLADQIVAAVVALGATSPHVLAGADPLATDTDAAEAAIAVVGAVAPGPTAAGAVLAAERAAVGVERAAFRQGMAALASLAERDAVIAADLFAEANLAECVARQAPTVVTDPRPATVVVARAGAAEIATGDLARPFDAALARVAAGTAAADLPAGAAARPIRGRSVAAGSCLRVARAGSHLTGPWSVTGRRGADARGRPGAGVAEPGARAVAADAVDAIFALAVAVLVAGGAQAGVEEALAVVAVVPVDAAGVVRAPGRAGGPGAAIRRAGLRPRRGTRGPGPWAVLGQGRYAVCAGG